MKSAFVLVCTALWTALAVLAVACGGGGDGSAAETPALTTLKHFRSEYEAHVREGRCTIPAPWRRRHAAPAAAH